MEVKNLIYLIISCKLVFSQFAFNDMEAVELLTKEVFTSSRSHCNIVMRPPDATNSQVQALRKLVKNISKRDDDYDTPSSVMVYNIKNYVVKYTTAESRRYGSCTKWLTITMVTNSTNAYLSKLSREFIFSKPIWLLFVNGSIEEHLKGVDLSINCRVWVIQPKEYVRNVQKAEDLSQICEGLYIYEVYKVRKSSPLRIEKSGCWTKTSGLILWDNRPRKLLRHDFRGQILTTCAIELWPIVGFHGGDAGKEREIDGFFASVWFELENALNFSSNISQEPYKSVSGILQEDGTWTGVIGKSILGEVDAILVDVDYTKARLDAVDLLLPIIKTDFQVFFKASETDDYLDLTAIFRPLHCFVWLSIGGTIVIAAIVHYFVNKTVLETGIEETRVTSLIDSVCFTVQAFCVQGCHCVPKTLAARFVFIVCYLTAAIILPMYSGSLISSLTETNPKVPFDKIQDIWTTDYKLMIPDNTSYYEFIVANSKPEIRDILPERNANVPPETFTNVKTAFNYLCQNKNDFGLFMADGANMDYLREQSKKACVLRTMKYPAATIYSSIAMTKNSHYSSALNFYLLRMWETGVMDRMRKKYLRKYQEEPPKRQWGLNLLQVAEIFLILISSLVLSIGIFLAEIFFFKLQQNPLYEKTNK